MLSVLWVLGFGAACISKQAVVMQGRLHRYNHGSRMLES